MYSTCLFCNAPFEKNESLEAFPVGRRLAFDEAKGRLWVVCKKCERWSLSPLDERWEAIEQAERLFRDSRKRVSTDNIGLAKVAEGTTLIRIGAPQRPEFAAWRYGDQFGRRRTRQMLLTGGSAAAVGALLVGGSVAGVGVGGFSYMWIKALHGVFRGNPDKVIAKIRDSSGRVMEVKRKYLGETVISRGESGAMTLDLRYKGSKLVVVKETAQVARFEGSEAQRVAAILLPQVNRFGGNKKQVAEAVREIEATGTAARFVDYLAETAGIHTGGMEKATRRSRREFHKRGLFAIPAPQRLALEMALHEEAERRALEGELAELERAWRDAEEIAAIADDLIVPDSVRDTLDRLKGGS